MNEGAKLGVFDSGLGGLLVSHKIRAALPDHDMVYFGDTLNLPYGVRSSETIYHNTQAAVEFLFSKGCELVVIACNTASAAALRRLQQGWLAQNYPDRRVLGVVVPTLEYAYESGHKRLGLIATNYTIGSGIYQEELKKLNPSIEIFASNTPLLVPLIENEGDAWLESVLRSYLEPIVDKGVDSVILGCTHYGLLKELTQQICGLNVDVLAQDDLIPLKLVDYLDRHSDLDKKIGRHGRDEFYLSEITDSYCKAVRKLYGRDLEIEKVR